MALRGQRLLASLGSTNTTPANNLIAASTTKTRYIRAILPYNNDTVPRTWSFTGSAAIITAANGEPFNESLPASGGRSLGPVVFPGRGLRIDINTTFSAVASVAAVVALEVIYDESDTADA